MMIMFLGCLIVVATELRKECLIGPRTKRNAESEEVNFSEMDQPRTIIIIGFNLQLEIHLCT